MSYEVELSQTKPSSKNSLAWSLDGELAIAAGEYVVILGMFLSCKCVLIMRSNCATHLAISLLPSA